SDDGGVVELPVAGVNDNAERAADGESVGLRDRGGAVDAFDLEGPERKRLARSDDGHRDVRRPRRAGALGADEAGGEGRGEDGQAQPRPEVEERAEMILVTVSENDAGNVRPLLLGIGDLGEDQIDTGQVGSGKGDAEVDDDPGPVMRPAVAVKGEIHANLA